MTVERDVLELDCLVVGAGPAGLAAAIAFKDRAEKAGKGDLEIAVLEKGSMPGVHSLSGAVVDPIGLDAVLPNWRELDPPMEATVEAEALYALSDELDAFMDVTIVYPQMATTGQAPTFWQLVSGQIPEIIVRAEKREIPDQLLGRNFRTDRNFRRDLEAWITPMWKEKDELITRLKQS